MRVLYEIRWRDSLVAERMEIQYNENNTVRLYFNNLTLKAEIIIKK